MEHYYYNLFGLAEKRFFFKNNLNDFRVKKKKRKPRESFIFVDLSFRC